MQLIYEFNKIVGNGEADFLKNFGALTSDGSQEEKIKYLTETQKRRSSSSEIVECLITVYPVSYIDC